MSSHHSSNLEEGSLCPGGGQDKLRPRNAVGSVLYCIFRVPEVRGSNSPVVGSIWPWSTFELWGHNIQQPNTPNNCPGKKIICAVIVRIRDNSKDGMCLRAGSSSLVWAIMWEHKVIAPTLIPQSHGVKVGEISVRKRRQRHHRSYVLTPVSIGHAGLAHLPNPYLLWEPKPGVLLTGCVSIRTVDC